MNVSITVPDTMIDAVFDKGFMPRLVVTDMDMAKILVDALAAKLSDEVAYLKTHTSKYTSALTDETLSEVHNLANDVLNVAAALVMATTDQAAWTADIDDWGPRGAVPDPMLSNNPLFDAVSATTTLPTISSQNAHPET